MKRVLLLLCDGTEVFEASAFYDVMGWAKVYGTEPVELVTAGMSDPVVCTFGLRIIPDLLLPDVQVDKFDALALPGGFEIYGYYKQAYSEQVSNLIQRFEQAEKPIASICVGALPLGKSGILTGRRATTYHLLDGKRRKQLAEFQVNVVDEPIVRDGNVITSTSPATAMEVAFALLTELTGKENTDLIRHLMGFAPTT